MAGRHRADRGYRARFGLMIFSIAGMNIGYTAVLPFLPQIQRELRLTPTLLTVFLLAYPVAKALTQWFLGGRATDRLGPAATAAAALTSGAVGMGIIALAHGPDLANAGRLVWGLGTGLGIPAIYRATGLMAARYDVPVARLRAGVGAGAVLTLALGPVVAGVVQTFAGFRTVLLVGAALSLLGAGTAAFALRLPRDSAAEVAAGPASDATAQPTAAVRGSVLPLVIFAGYELTLNLLFAAAEPLVPLYVAEHRPDSAGYSALVLGVGLGVWVVATLLSGIARPWLRSPAAGTVSLLVLAASCVALTNVSALPIGLTAIAVFMLAQGHGYLVARDGIDNHTDASGTVWGRFNAIADIGFLLGPPAAVAAYTHVGKFAFPVLGATTAIAAAAFAGASVVLLRARTALRARHARARAGALGAEALIEA